MIKLAINGLGRIGRCVLRCLYERGLQHQFEVVAINDPAPLESMVHLLNFDSTYGRFSRQVNIQDGGIVVGHSPVIRTSHTRTPSQTLWPDADLVLDCSGTIKNYDQADHLITSQQRLLISNPASGDIDATIIYGVNEHIITPSMRVISAGSCTSNAVVPVLQLLDSTFGVRAGSSLSIHSAMNDQPVIDAFHSTDLHLVRGALNAIIPVPTALDKGIYRFLPHLVGRLVCSSVRVPTQIVSAIDLTVTLKQPTSLPEIESLIMQSHLYRDGIVSLTTLPLVSTDFLASEYSAVIDITQSAVVDGRLVKLFIWFDNEWAYANRMLDLAALCSAQK